MIGRRIREEGGWAVLTVMLLLGSMMITGVALLAVVDVQSEKVSEERRAESAFTLAEGALNAQAFAMSRAWPEFSAQGACTQATASDPDDGCPDADRLAEQFDGDEYDGATWQTDVFDNAGTATTYWTDDAAAQQQYDANNDGRVWVRSRATTADKTRTVVGMAQVQRPPAFPEGFGGLAGGFQTSLSQFGSDVSPTLSIPLLDALIGDHKLVSGKMGIRCGLLDPLPESLVGCVSAANATLNETQLASVLPSDIVHYGVQTATNDDVVAQLRQRAKRQGHYIESVAAGAACLPSGTSGHGTYFIEKVGDGDDTCTLNTSANPTANVMAVANGRIDVQTGTFNGVVYALNRQEDDLDDAVVTVRNGAHVNGGVYIDGMGGLAVYPPTFNVAQACRDALPTLLEALCNTTTVAIVNAILTNVLYASYRTAFVAALVAQVTASSPVITYDCRYVTDDAVKCPSHDEAYLVRANGTAGTVQATFREIASPAS